LPCISLNGLSIIKDRRNEKLKGQLEEVTLVTGSQHSVSSVNKKTKKKRYLVKTLAIVRVRVG